MRALLLLPLALLSGCILQGGGHLGATMHADGKTRSSWGGRVQSRLNLGEVTVPVQLGLEVEGRAEYQRGGFVTGGFLAGYELRLSRSAGLGLYGEFGWPAGWGPPLNGFYGGATLELPVELAPERLFEANRNYRFVDARAGIVPQVRVRLFDLRPAEQPSAGRFSWELSFGFAVRSRLLTDIL